MISDKLVDDMKIAMKTGDKLKLSVIRMLRSELKNARIAAGKDLTDDDEAKILMSYAKKRREVKQQYLDAGRSDLADKEESEYQITMSYLPEQLDEAKIVEIVKSKIEETGAQGAKDFGRVMKAVMLVVGSRAEGATVSAAVKKALGG